MGSNLEVYSVVFTAGRRWAETQRKGLRAYQRRLELIDKLGGKCLFCRSRKNLELDHINGRDWDPAKKSRWSRIVIYEREAKEGKLQVLCRRCNAKKGKR